MKITYLTHACLLIEINKIKIITDPWLVGPSWGGSLWHYPTHNYKPSNLPVPDIIFFSHGHDDHFHEETIKNFPKEWFVARIIAPKYNVSWWEGELKKKFKKTFFLDHNQIFQIDKSSQFQIFLNDRGDFDCSFKIKTKKNCVFFQTDNLMSEKEAKRISKIDKIDLAFVIPFLIGAFPGFYKWDSDTLVKLANEKTHKSLSYCCNIIKSLKAKYTVPYACDLGYLGDKFHINLIHRRNKKDLVKMIRKKKIKTKPKILFPGDTINLSGAINFNQKVKKEISDTDSLIRFSNEKNNEYKNYQLREKSIKKPHLNKLIKIFSKNLKRNIKNKSKFKFKTLINIKEGIRNKYLLLDFNKNLIKEISTIKPANLRLEIESTKIRNLLFQKYPMNFMTFHNGGYECERKVMNLSRNEKRYWSWIYNLDFFI